MMKNTLVIVLILLLICTTMQGQAPIEGSYIQLSQEEYNELKKINQENELDGKYYVREFQDKKLVGIHKIEYRKGEKQGEWLHFLIFRKKGTLDLSTIENYEDDQRNGYYYNSDNGFTFTEEGNYEKGKKEGVWNVSKGGSTEKIQYKNGKKHGDYWRQDASGVIVKGTYKKGEKLDNWTIEDLSGNTHTSTQVAETSGITQKQQTIEGTIHKPDGSIVPIAVVRLQLMDTDCAYAFTDYDGKFSIEIDTNQVASNSYFEIVIEGFPKKIVPFSDFSNKGIIVLDNGRKKVTYDEYSEYYESMKDCQ
ncbi:toxin-antitoxin system YwqK family antitoxin [Aquimarina sp. M1]